MTSSVTVSTPAANARAVTNLLYSELEDGLRQNVRETLGRALNDELVAGLADAPDTDVTGLWRLLAGEVGLAGLLIPEELDGVGLGPREAAVVLEELGRAVAPVPFLTSAVIATTVLLEAAGGAAGAALRSLAAGQSVATLVLPWTARAGAWAPAAKDSEPVAGAIGADQFLFPVTGAAGAVELRLLTRDDVDIEPLTSLDMTRPLARVRLRAPGAGQTLLTGAPAAAAVDAGLRAGQALLASEQLGVAQWCLDTTVAYAKTRIQFARPIGSFQAIKHRLADLYLLLVQAQAAAREAAGTLADGHPDAALAQAVAQAHCADAAVTAAEEALQLHGGIGMAWEHPIHPRLKRAKADQLALGTPARHRADIAQLVSLPPQ